jgi:hypothetical protein
MPNEVNKWSSDGFNLLIKKEEPEKDHGIDQIFKKLR